MKKTKKKTKNSLGKNREVVPDVNVEKISMKLKKHALKILNPKNVLQKTQMENAYNQPVIFLKDLNSNFLNANKNLFKI